MNVQQAPAKLAQRFSESSMGHPAPRSRPPLINCSAQLAKALGAIRLNRPSDAHRYAPAFIPVRTHDGRIWAWPIEQGFVRAILKR